MLVLDSNHIKKDFSEVRQVDSSSFILLSQDDFGYSMFFFLLYFHTKCEIICSRSVKNTVGSLIRIALNL